MKLSTADHETYLYLRGLGILKDVLPRKMPPEQASKGIILTCCADGDQFDDTYAHIAQVCLEYRPSPRIHVLPRMGGALVIPRSSPLHRERYGADLVDDILDSYRIKNIEIVALYAHAPCGAAGRAELSLAEVLDYLAKAKLELKQAAEKADISLNAACFVHIDRGQDGKRTYFFPVGQWQLLAKHHPVKHGKPWPPTLSRAVSL